MGLSLNEGCEIRTTRTETRLEKWIRLREPHANNLDSSETSRGLVRSEKNVADEEGAPARTGWRTLYNVWLAQIVNGD